MRKRARIVTFVIMTGHRSSVDVSNTRIVCRLEECDRRGVDRRKERPRIGVWEEGFEVRDLARRTAERQNSPPSRAASWPTLPRCRSRLPLRPFPDLRHGIAAQLLRPRLQLLHRSRRRARRSGQDSSSAKNPGRIRSLNHTTASWVSSARFPKTAHRFPWRKICHLPFAPALATFP